MQIYSLRNWPNRKAYSTFNEFFKHTNILQVCVRNLINLCRKNWLSVQTGLGDKTLSDPSFHLLFYIHVIKNVEMHPKQTYFHFHVLDLPTVTESPNGILLLGFLSCAGRREIPHIVGYM